MRINNKQKIFHIIFCLVMLSMISIPIYASGGSQQLWQNYYSDIRQGRLRDEPKYQFKYEQCFRASAKKHQVPLTVLIALARGESEFDPYAGLGKKGHHAFGIMQLQWFDGRNNTAKELGFKSKKALFNPCENIDAGAKYLSWLLQQLDQDMYKAIAAYNVGIGNLKRGAKPKSARWYSDYIYHHLKYVASMEQTLPKSNLVAVVQASEQLKGQSEKTTSKLSSHRYTRQHYKRSKKLPVIRFYSMEKAERFIQFLTRKANKKKQKLELDWFKNDLGETYV
ncbi:MAG TPA: hypothetical protein ENJ41_08660, partial [Oceanospirillales bacterium]|nr:hypothetical protein [Oceanospirillales bacterium]